MDAAWVDQRLPVLAAVLVFVATAPVLLRRGEAIAWFVAFALLLTLRVGAVASVWSEHDADLAALRQVIAEVPAGAKVLVVRPELSTDGHRFDGEPASRHFMIDNDSLTHLPSLLVLERHAFMPLLFSDPIKQPLRVKPPYDRIAKVDGAPPYVHALSAPTQTDIDRALYLQHWRDDFDYVLLIRPGSVPGAPTLLPDILEPIASNAIVGLYRIRKSS
jgi:hypothetical protein